MLWSRSFDPSKDLLDLTGKVILVTGGKCVFLVISWFSVSNVPNSSVAMGSDTRL